MTGFHLFIPVEIGNISRSTGRKTVCRCYFYTLVAVFFIVPGSQECFFVLPCIHFKKPALFILVMKGNHNLVGREYGIVVFVAGGQV